MNNVRKTNDHIAANDARETFDEKSSWMIQTKSYPSLGWVGVPLMGMTVLPKIAKPKRPKPSGDAGLVPQEAS